MKNQQTDLRAAGDLMQSALSRIVTWAKQLDGVTVDYETRMAMAEADHAIEDWTEARRQD